MRCRPTESGRSVWFKAKPPRIAGGVLNMLTPSKKTCTAFGTCEACGFVAFHARCTGDKWISTSIGEVTVLPSAGMQIVTEELVPPAVQLCAEALATLNMKVRNRRGSRIREGMIGALSRRSGI